MPCWCRPGSPEGAPISRMTGTLSYLPQVWQWIDSLQASPEYMVWTPTLALVLVLAALGVLGFLYSFFTAVTKEVAERDKCTIPELQEQFQQEMKDGRSVTYIAQALCARANGEQPAEARGEIISSGGMDSLMEAIRMHGESQLVVIKCYAALIPLLSLPLAKAKLQQSLDFLGDIVGLVNLNVKALERGRDANTSTDTWECAVAEVVRQSCLVMGACVDGDRRVQSALASAGAIDAILAAMKWFPHHTDLLKWAMLCLFNLTYDNLPNKAMLAAKGGLQQVITSMRRHIGTLEIQRLSIATLYSALQKQPEDDERPWRRNHDGDDDDDDDGGDERACLDVGSMRAVALSNSMIEAVEETMHMYKEDGSIQGMATQLLSIATSRRQIVSQPPARCDQSKPLSPVAAF